jgi:hypothetical protein
MTSNSAIVGGVTFLSCYYKICEGILTSKIKKITDMTGSEAQHAFSWKTPTVDVLFTIILL